MIDLENDEENKFKKQLTELIESFVFASCAREEAKPTPFEIDDKGMITVKSAESDQT